jgi:hypothetical protein
MTYPQYSQPLQSPPRGRVRRGRRRGCLVAVAAVLVIVAVVVIAAALSAGGGGTTYSARVQDRVVLNPASLAVTVRVTNTGSSAGTPACTIQASDPSGAYTGTDVATLRNPVAAGATAVFADDLVITSQGARFVTSVTVSCGPS